ncbi:MAG: hypothetical protein DHS80DRAFT_32408 [Piptocephalis tieghemiana]|nr:MAG: hypothetical protein DHS80DRAFT_32408 [Piptocephalis tieghemiana]
MTITQEQFTTFDESTESHDLASQHSSEGKGFFHEVKGKMSDFIGRHKSDEEAEEAHKQVYEEEKTGERKAHKSHELIAAAAGYEAVKAYQKHREEKGLSHNHSTIKQIVGGLAMAEAVKLLETRGHSSSEEKQKAAAAAAAQAEAMVDQKYN